MLCLPKGPCKHLKNRPKPDRPMRWYDPNLAIRSASDSIRNGPNTTTTIFQIISQNVIFQFWGTPGWRIKCPLYTMEHSENTKIFHLMRHQMPIWCDIRCKTFGKIMVVVVFGPSLSRTRISQPDVLGIRIVRVVIRIALINRDQKRHITTQHIKLSPVTPLTHLAGQVPGQKDLCSWGSEDSTQNWTPNHPAGRMPPRQRSHRPKKIHVYKPFSFSNQDI